ncbi:glycoside hydrolase family 16 protein, partial [Trichoderma citrinoviride]
MLSKTFTTAALALAASTLVSAQTSTDCNPLEKTCPNDPAFGKNSGNCDFSKGACSSFESLPGTTLKYSGNGAVFSISTETEAPTIRTGKYIFFGRIDVEVQAAAGAGIVTSAVLQSDDLDEIDWEWVGGDNAQAQTNYFSKGNTATYDRGAFHPVDNPLGSFHTYSVEWTSAGVTWLIDNNVVRTLTAANAEGGASGLPQTPMQVKLGTWVAGRKDAPTGTVEWAGGYTDFSKAPFVGYYKSISIVDYAGADAPTSKSVKEYIYGDHSGSWQSIK